MYGVYTVFLQGHHQTYSQIRCIYTVPANPSYFKNGIALSLSLLFVLLDHTAHGTHIRSHRHRHKHTLTNTHTHLYKHTLIHIPLLHFLYRCSGQDQQQATLAASNCKRAAMGEGPHPVSQVRGAAWFLEKGRKDIGCNRGRI
jgi:hypothetical protein